VAWYTTIGISIHGSQGSSSAWASLRSGL